MSRVFDTYRAVHEQAFIPLFVRDDHDSIRLIEACLEAGCRVIEYTQRRPDADTMIPWLRRHCPELHVLAGSTLDDDRVLRRARRRHPQLRTLSELADMGVDGFVSLVGWRPENIARYAATHLVVPAAMTVNEAYQQSVAGAHFIKVVGPGLELAALCRNPAGFEFCPVFITGGMTAERIPEAMAAGAMAIGSGFDLMLRDQAGDGGKPDVVRVLRRYLDVSRSARDRACPALARARSQDPLTWLKALPHNHPFDQIERPGEAGCDRGS